jgi:hypothetical protein
MTNFNREIDEYMYRLEKFVEENKNVYEYLVEVYGAEVEDNIVMGIVCYIANLYDFELVDRLA